MSEEKRKKLDELEREYWREIDAIPEKKKEGMILDNGISEETLIFRKYMKLIKEVDKSVD